MGLYEVPLSMSLLGFGMRIMLANFHMCGIMLLLRVLNMPVRNVSTRGPMSFRCLMVSLSGRYELFFLICYIASWNSVVVSVMLYPCIFCVNLFVFCVVCLTVFVICLVNLDVASIGVGGIWVWRELSPHLGV